MASGDILTYDDILFKKIPTELGVNIPLPRFSEEEEKELKKGRLPTFGDIKTKFSSIAKVINRSGVKDNQLVVNDDFVFGKNIVIDWKEKYPWLHFGPIPNTAGFAFDKIYLTQSVPNTTYSATLIPIKGNTEFLDNPTTIIENVSVNDGSALAFSLFNPFELFKQKYSLQPALWINVSQIKSFKSESGSTTLKDAYNNYYTLKDDDKVKWLYDKYSFTVDDDNFVKFSYYEFREGEVKRGYWPDHISSYNIDIQLSINILANQHLDVQIALPLGNISSKSIMFRVRFTDNQAETSKDSLLGEYGFVLQLK